MKPMLPLALFTVVASIVGTNAAAQDVAAGNLQPTAVVLRQDPQPVDGSEAAGSGFADKIVLDRFTKRFAAAADAAWTNIGACYQVSFNNNGRRCRAVFTQKGEMNYLISELSREQLPQPLRNRIKKGYKGYALLQALEITAHSRVAYQAVLENADRFITLKFTADGMEEMNEQKKKQ